MPIIQLFGRPPLPCSVLILQYPPGVPGLPRDAAAPFLAHFTTELLPRLSTPPTRLAIVGVSLGGALAVMLARAFSLHVSAVSTVGGVGMAEALELRGLPPFPRPCTLSLAVNAEDPCHHYSVSFQAALLERGMPARLEERTGGHAFAEYERNGLLAWACSTALSSLGT